MMEYTLVMVFVSVTSFDNNTMLCICYKVRIFRDICLNLLL